jgi:ubiquinone biosynthesis accessory factor UbiJ
MLGESLAKLLNRGLPRSPRARQLCASLAGKSVSIAVRDLGRMRLSSTGDTLNLALGERGAAGATPASVATTPASADATLTGGPLSLLALGGEGAQAVLQRGDVRVDGDTEVAEKFRELLQLLQPDLEEELALLIGDVPAHQLARCARLARRSLRRAAATTLENLAEYLGHERADLVSRNEGEQFLRGVDTVREGVDRLEARLELLARRRRGGA